MHQAPLCSIWQDLAAAPAMPRFVAASHASEQQHGPPAVAVVFATGNVMLCKLKSSPCLISLCPNDGQQ